MLGVGVCSLEVSKVLAQSSRARQCHRLQVRMIIVGSASTYLRILRSRSCDRQPLRSSSAAFRALTNGAAAESKRQLPNVVDNEPPHEERIIDSNKAEGQLPWSK